MGEQANRAEVGVIQDAGMTIKPKRTIAVESECVAYGS